MTFREWILQFKEDHNPIGHLAMDISNDNDFPRNMRSSTEYRRIKKYLENNNAIEDAMKAFEDAWNAYSLTKHFQRVSHST